jgi:2-methylcitrate dehydratase PrpD
MAIRLTEELGRFAAGLRYEDVPPNLIVTIKSGFADCVGTMLAGAHEQPTELLKEVLQPGGDEATLLFDPGQRASAADAALINGIAAHALDLDDVGLNGHPSVTMVPSLLAEGEATGASGRQVLAAYAAGYETWGELLRRDADTYHEKGWHPTGILGPIAAAAACASLRGLSPGQAAQALAIAASHASGLASNFGSMTKPLHAGRAAQAGILSARLAASGFTAAPDAIEHRLGFLHAVSRAGRIDLESPLRAGREWRLATDGLTIKKYALCFATHCALDGLIALIDRTGIDAGEVERLDVTVNRRHGTILRYPQPQTGLEAKFSMQFAMASGLIAHSAGLAELVDDFVRRSDVQELMKKVVVHLEDEDPAHPGFSLHDQVVIRTRDGRTLETGRLTSIRGGPLSPLGRDELWTKFSGCVGSYPVDASGLFDALMALEHVPRISGLPGLAGPASGRHR